MPDHTPQLVLTPEDAQAALDAFPHRDRLSHAARARVAELEDNVAAARAAAAAGLEVRYFGRSRLGSTYYVSRGCANIGRIIRRPDGRIYAVARPPEADSYVLRDRDGHPFYFRSPYHALAELQAELVLA